MKKRNEKSFIGKAGDWRCRTQTQGLQLHTTYYDVWSTIKAIFKGHGTEVCLNKYNPMLTMETLRDVERASGLAEVLIVNPKIREILSHRYVAKTENYLKGQLFLTLLRIIPKYERINSQESLGKWLNEPDGQLQELIDSEGTVKEMDKQAEEIMKRLFEQ